jgi:ElaB/YqjD/DUF883 family membrane-anchored ribosome-binding protein
MVTTTHTDIPKVKPQPTIDKVAKSMHDAVDKAADAAAPAAEWIDEKAESLKETQRTLLDDSCKYVSAHPLKSLVIAATAGFILSRIIR